MRGMSSEDIGKEFDISRQRVNFVLNNAYQLLRKKLTEQGIRGQEEGVLYSTDRGDGSVEDLLKELRKEMPSLAEIEAFRQRHGRMEFFEGRVDRGAQKRQRHQNPVKIFELGEAEIYMAARDTSIKKLFAE